MHLKLGAIFLSGMLTATAADAASMNTTARKAARYFQP